MKFLTKILILMTLMVGLLIGGLTAIQMHVEEKDLDTIVKEDIKGFRKDCADFTMEIALALENN